MNKLKLKVKLLNRDLPLPKYQTPGAAGLDLYARLPMEIPAKEVAYVPLNVAMELPQGHWSLIAARSSLHKKGLMMANGIGVGDEDYCGDEDEYHAALYNFSDKEVKIEQGERLVQLLILPKEPVAIESVEQLDNQNRGGFGTTGS